MNAIQLLEAQHREAEEMFSGIEAANSSREKQRLFNDLADFLAVHAAIEEIHFYPAVKAKRTEEILLESLEEHLGIKRVIADLLKTKASDETFDAKMKVLQEQVDHHVEEEEDDLFPKVKKILDADMLEAIGQQMIMEQIELAKGAPRRRVPSETDEAASLG
jgi:hemerythrin superfamily protein